jgi:putative two-component system response regulator
MDPFSDVPVKIIFVVDDSAVNLARVRQALEGSYRVLTMPSADKMFALLEKIMPDLILLDIEMPEMDGFTVLERLKENESTANIPVIFLTAYRDEAKEIHGFELGAVDFIGKPFSAPVLLNRISHHLHIEKLIHNQTDLLQQRTNQLEKLNTGIISIVAELVENRDKLTGKHIESTTKFMKILIDAMLERGVYAEELKKYDIEAAIAASRLHDVGKITISDLILNKPAKLTEDEFKLIKTHAKSGEQIIESIIKQAGSSVFLEYAKLFASYHHEFWDGSGYPYGLKGTDIPLSGRIMAIVDVYDALISKRVYKSAFSHEEAMAIIKSERGKHFDPEIADVFLGIQEQIKAEAEKL